MAGEEERWRPEARAQQSSAIWLQSYGLESQSLSMDQLLPTLGFKQKTGSVPTSSDKVTSLYGEGLFVQYPDSRGNIYNICANDAQLVRIEQQLNQFVSLLKSRLQWLNSSSRLLLGALVHSHVTIIVDSSLSDASQLTSFLDAVKLFLSEQVSAIVKFNVIRCTGSLTGFADNLLKVTPEVVRESIDWLDEGHVTSSSVAMTNNLVEAVTRAIACEGSDAVYLLTQGRSALRSYPSLFNMLQLSHVPVNISVYECTDSGALDDYKELCRVCSGRLHVYNPKTPVYDPAGPVSSRPSSRPSSAASSTNSSSSKTKTPPSMPREDVLLVWEELERGRDTLAEMQLIQLEKQTVGRSERHPLPQPCKEEYMSSIQWIEVHGLKANSLLFSDLVNKLAFQHCEGVLRLSPGHDATTNHYNDVQLVEHSKLVGAQYCKDFVHLKWRNGKVIHAHLDERTYQSYCSKVMYYVKKYEERMEWLKKDSRELFGTILENKIVVVVDTSSSLEGRFNLIKRKLRQLLREQILHKTSFNLIQFSTDVIRWRDYLVPTTPQNMSAAREWIDGMGVSGSTNTLEALRQAVEINGAEAVYFLTDGRPDQSPDFILSQLQQWRRIPIHSISFNCADSKANQFLFRLASVTGGRYHYYSEDITDPDGPVTHQSDDLQLLGDEIGHAHEQLTQAQQLRESCSKLKHGGQRLAYSVPKKKRLRRASTSDTLVSLSKWLKKNSLSRRNLLLMDALGPTAVPHNPKHVPILDKHVHGKVYEGLLSTAHISGRGRVTLVNPLGVDLVSYEAKLSRYLEECEEVIDKAIMGNILPNKIQEIKDTLELGETETLQYRKHRDQLRGILRENGCGHLVSELDQMEMEMRKANTLKTQAACLREESGGRSKKKKWSSELSIASSTSGSGPSTASNISGEEGADGRTINTAVTSPIKTKLSNEYGRSIKRGHHVIGPDPTDGLYYPGVVSSVPTGGSCQVLFSTGVNATLAIKLLLPIKGSTPCPALRPGDYVFVRTRVKILKGDVYLPGVVMALPENPRVGGALFSASVFGGRIVTCSRSSLVKIGRGRYREACDCLINWLRKREKLNYRDTGPETSTPKKGKIHVLPREPSTLSSSDESIPINAQSPDESKPLSPFSPGPDDAPPDAPSYHGPVTMERGTSPIPLSELRVERFDKETCTSLQSLIVTNEEEGEGGQTEERDDGGTTLINGEEDKVTDTKQSSPGAPEPKGPEESVDKSGDLTIGMLDSTQNHTFLNSAEEDEEEQVLARWMDDGWYYRSIVVGKGEESWIVRDANGDEEVCPRDDIITDHDDASILIKVGDPVISLHPSFPLSYAPGTVIGIMSDGLSFLVELYDEMQGLVPRHELYSCSETKAQEVIEFIKTQERAWVGKPVIARRPTDHLFHPGIVLKQKDSSQDFVVRWLDGTTHTIEVTDMFGELTRRRPLYTDDYIIALPEEISDGAGGVCHPSKIIGVQGEKLIIQLHNNKLCLASLDHCFWISDAYYHNSVSLIRGGGGGGAVGVGITLQET